MPEVPGDQRWDAIAPNPPYVPNATDWARAKATVAKSRVTETVESCVQAAKSALRAGYMIECVKCLYCTAALLGSAAPKDGMHVCSVCKHSWAGPCVASNPLAELQPHLSSEGVVVFETNRTWELVAASKFVKQRKSQVVFLATVKQIGALNVTHRAAHGSDVEHRFEGSTKLLAELE